MNTTDNIIIISGSEETRLMLSQIISEEFERVSVSDGSGIAKKLADVSSEAYSAAVIAPPLANGYGLDVAEHILTHTDTAVIIITAAKNTDELYKKAGRDGAFILPKPVSKPALIQSIRFLADNRRRMLEIQSENRQLSDKIREIKLVDRAKCVLIQYLRLTEPEAHKHIQKQAMDRRISLTEVARDILKAYEYL